MSIHGYSRATALSLEVLDIIMSYVPEGWQMAECRLVCKSWKAAADRYYHRVLYMDSDLLTLREVKDQVRYAARRGRVAQELVLTGAHYTEQNFDDELFRMYPNINTLDIRQSAPNWTCMDLCRIFRSDRCQLKHLPEIVSPSIQQEELYPFAVEHADTLESLSIRQNEAGRVSNSVPDGFIISHLSKFSNLRFLDIQRHFDTFEALDNVLSLCPPLVALCLSLALCDLGWEVEEEEEEEGAELTDEEKNSQINKSWIAELWVTTSNRSCYGNLEYLSTKFSNVEHWYIFLDTPALYKALETSQAIELCSRFIKAKSFYFEPIVRCESTAPIVNSLLCMQDSSFKALIISHHSVYNGYRLANDTNVQQAARMTFNHFKDASEEDNKEYNSSHRAKSYIDESMIGISLPDDHPYRFLDVLNDLDFEKSPPIVALELPSRWSAPLLGILFERCQATESMQYRKTHITPTDIALSYTPYNHKITHFEVESLQIDNSFFPFLTRALPNLKELVIHSILVSPFCIRDINLKYSKLDRLHLNMCYQHYQTDRYSSFVLFRQATVTSMFSKATQLEIYLASSDTRHYFTVLPMLGRAVPANPLQFYSQRVCDEQRVRISCYSVKQIQFDFHLNGTPIVITYDEATQTVEAQ